MSVHRRGTRLLAALAAAVVVSSAAASSRASGVGRGDALQRGGLVLVLRHAATDFSKPDQDPVDLADCSTQRNLSARGRADARAIGRGVGRLRPRIGAVFTSPFCRTREPARVAFGRGRVSPALLNTVNSAHASAWETQVRAARRLFGTIPPKPRVTVLVIHGSVVGDVTGLSLEEGETLVFRAARSEPLS